MIPVTTCSFLSTHRLIPSRYSPEGTVLRDLVDSEEEVLDAAALDGSTDARISGEYGLLPGIGVHELVFGVPYGNIVNAAFTHTSLSGGRFHDRMRNAWYAGTDLKTSMYEVAYHRIHELQEVAWMEDEISTFDDYLADFNADFHDLRGDHPAFQKYLRPIPIPQCYAESQKLANELLARGSSGVVYPSVRWEQGVCVACFRPALVAHVCRGVRLEFQVNASKDFELGQVRQIAP